MFETLLRHFADSPLSLWGPFIVLILCGLGLPVPEDIALVAAGALAEIDGRTWLETSAVMYVGVMLGDATIFFAGRHLGGRLRHSRWFLRGFSEKKQAKVEALFERYHSTVLFVGRFLPGLRAPIFFTAGSTRVQFWKFFLFDGLAALLSVPFFVWLGHWLWAEFNEDLTRLEHELARMHSYSLLAAGVILLVVVFAVVRLVRKSRTSWDD